MRGTVHVVDDDRSARKALARLLRAYGYQVRIYAAGQQLLDVAFDDDLTEAACVLLDLQMAELNGLETFEKLAESNHPPVIFVSGHGNVADCATAMKKGAIDFLEKPVNADELTSVIDKALERCVVDKASRCVIKDYEMRIARLTKREREIMHHIISGRLNKVVAGDLGISEKTVKVHRARLLKKMQVSSLAELTRICTVLGLEPADRHLSSLRGPKLVHLAFP